MGDDLSLTSAAGLCRDLAQQGATGTLHLDGPGGSGTVTVEDGQIVASTSPTPRARIGDRLVGAGYLDEDRLADALDRQRSAGSPARLGAVLVEQGMVPRDAVRLFLQEQLLDALFELLHWSSGTARFEPGAPSDVPEVPLRLPVDEALVEVARRQEEWQELSRVIPGLDAVPAFRQGASSASAALEPDEFAVLASVDGQRSIRALAEDLGYGEFEAARIVYGLSLLGIVEVAPPDEPDDDTAAAPDAGPAEEPAAHPDRAGEDAAPPPLAAAEAASAAPEGAADGPPDDPVGSEADDADRAIAADAARSADTRPRAASSELTAALRELAREVGEAHAPPDDDAGADAGADADADQGVDAEAGIIVEADLEGLALDGPGAGAASASGELGETSGGPTDSGPPPVDAARRSAADPDVSEFLRELSRLALEDEGEPPPAARAPAAPPRRDPRQPTQDDARPRRRGLFGRGG